MRGSKAKAIRREFQKVIKQMDVNFQYYKTVSGQVFNRYRMAYQKMKVLSG